MGCAVLGSIEVSYRYSGMQYSYSEKREFRRLSSDPLSDPLELDMSV